ncbi:paxillin [Fonticula alba]|uniref:Paxillin n=1 Tax=Fonticula alba TaxID=691883 RepID=A0A058Z589_FONAL|nr:paxillin [Fonticula alba]KCV69420.1 paxillin [Fonticula alba]|eukprot:XP_009495985.1 paxillin [Fonticula alba]
MDELDLLLQELSNPSGAPLGAKAAAPAAPAAADPTPAASSPTVKPIATLSELDALMASLTMTSPVAAASPKPAAPVAAAPAAPAPVVGGFAPPPVVVAPTAPAAVSPASVSPVSPPAAVQPPAASSNVTSSVDALLSELATPSRTFSQPPPPAATSPPAPAVDSPPPAAQTFTPPASTPAPTGPSKGNCGSCNEPVIGEELRAMGKIFHPEHFTCLHCRKSLSGATFFEHNSNSFCDKCYHDRFSPRCAYCDGAIRDRCINALGKTWHPDHFFCSQCGKSFGDSGFMEKDGKAYCEEDYFNMFAPKCGGCDQAIMADCITALSRQWHPACFVCQDCRAPFEGGAFFDHEGLPYCEKHYHSQKGSLCAACQRPIIGRCITAIGRRFHPEHFVCAHCTRQLAGKTFKEQSSKAYCTSCHIKLFG